MSVIERPAVAGPGHPYITNGNASLARAFERVGDPSIAVLSVDVFDTLLWRMAPDPVDVFPLLGERLRKLGLLAAHVSPLVFGKLRRAAELRARGELEARGGGEEVALAAIYDEIPSEIFCGRASVERLVAIELDLEKDVLRPDLDMVELVRAARERGKEVVALSDTYLSERHLRSLLDPAYHDDARIDRVFSSSDHRVSKWQGGLFELMLREVGAEPGRVVHVGDNEHSDVTSPRSLGIHTVHLQRWPQPLGKLLAREQVYLDDERLRPEGDAGLTAMRARVLQHKELQLVPEELRPFWRYGAVALGPSLTGFAEWVHLRARSAQVGKVLCLMREGDFLAGMIRTAGEYLGSEVAAETLWLSRQLCARATILEGSEEELERLLSRRREPTVRELCSTLGVAIEGLSPSFQESADARLNEAWLAKELIKELSSSAELRSAIVSEARLLRERIVRYVAGKLPPGEPRIALVDLGWGGSIQSMLDVILDHGGGCAPTLGLYLMTHDLGVVRLLDNTQVEGYIGSCGLPGPVVRSIMRSPEILEQICMVDVGSQIGLTSDLEPVLAERAQESFLQPEERDAVQKGVLAFQREWARYATALPGGVASLATDASRELVGAQLARAVVAPTAEEAAIFGRWRHDENFGSVGTESMLGDAHSARALRHMDPQTLAELPMSCLYWPFGLAALHDEHLAAAADAVVTQRLSWEAFGSVVETGDFEVYYDNGYGFTQGCKYRLEPRRNRFGLSYIRAVARDEMVRGIRLDPVKAACILRIDWISFRCWQRGRAEPIDILIERPEDLARIVLRNCELIAPKVLLVRGTNPQLEFDLRGAIGGFAYAVEVECGYAVLPITPAREAGGAKLTHTRGELAVRRAKRLLRQAESRAGAEFAEPLRRAWRRASMSRR